MRRLAAVCSALLATGCASVAPPSPYTSYPQIGRSLPQRSTTSALSPLDAVSSLPGWLEEDHRTAFQAFRATCGVSRDPGMAKACAAARDNGREIDDTAARLFFESWFRVEPIPGPGLLTAYFSPEYPARTQPDEVFSAALRPPPYDLVLMAPGLHDPPGRKLSMQSLDGALQPYADRTSIELTAPTQALAWMRPEDLFFLQIQGSGGVVFPDGRRLKAIYAADNGRPFTPIARTMVAQGLLAPEHASGEAIRSWLATHRGAQAQAVMDLNPRYIFFSLQSDDGLDATGAAGVPLPAGRAIAVDPAFHRYGELYWIDAVSPVLAGAVKRYRRLVMALDTGSAIRGDVRADLYLGRGEAAGLEAGRVRHNLLMVRLAPKNQPWVGQAR